MKTMARMLPLLAFSAAVGCEPVQPPDPAEQPAKKEWAIALHGGAGKPPQGLPPEQLGAYKATVRETLERALTTGRDMLKDGRTSVEVVEAVVRVMEDDPNLNAGRGAVMNIEGTYEMHASIMDGKTRDCGAVAAIDTVRNPISLARLVMEKTDFVLLVGEGAEFFGREMEVAQADAEYFRTDFRYRNWINARKELGLPLPEEEGGGMGRRAPDENFDPDEMVGTVGCVALDKHGNIAAATSTGGVAHKRFGRMGDSSIIGAGNYADNRTCAISCTGQGEHFIRNSVAFHVAALMKYKEMPVDTAARYVIEDVLKEGTGGLIAIDTAGNIAMDYNRDGMRRAAADSAGKFLVEYWE